MTVEERLRDAITAHTTLVEPDEDAAWERIEARLRPARKRTRLVALAAAVLVVAGAVVVIVANDERPETRLPAGPGPTSTTPPGNPDWWVWPPPTSDRLFDTPQAAALSFAREFLGIEDPVATSADDSNAMWPSVSVRRRGSQVEMRVITGRRGEHHGFGVRSAQSDGLAVTAPVDFDVLSSPLRPTGETPSSATVLMALVEDGQMLAGPLAGTSFAGGSALPKLFWGPPSQPMGSFVLATRSADGTVERASVVRVRLDPKAGIVPESFVATTVDGRVVYYRTSDLAEQGSASVPGAAALSVDDLLGYAWVESAGGHVNAFGLQRGLASEGSSRQGRAPVAYGMSLAYVFGANAIAFQDLESPRDPRSYGFSRNQPVEITALAWSPEYDLAISARYEDRFELYLFKFMTGRETDLDGARLVARPDARVYRFPVFTDGQLGVYRSDFRNEQPGDVVLVDPSTSKATPLFQPGFRITTLDVDKTGRHWLFVDDEHVLWRWSGDRIERVATGIVDAEW